MPKVSIIIPIYGVEKYIQRCAESLFQQTLDDIEYIFVNDCTKDNSIRILEGVIQKYSYRKDQVKIVNHAVNKGLPSARKTGIELASGEYILNCDSDDWLDLYMAKQMYETAINECADVVLCDFAVGAEGDFLLKKGCIDTCKAQVIMDMCSMKIPWSVCNKLIKKDLFQTGIVYPTCNMGEDMALTTQVVLASTKISYVPAALYYYFVNPSSITQAIDEKSVIKKFQQYLNNVDIVLPLFQKLGMEKDYEKAIDIIKFNGKRILWGAGRNKSIHTLWLKTFPEIDRKIFFNTSISFKERIKYYLCLLNLYPH